MKRVFLIVMLICIACSVISCTETPDKEVDAVPSISLDNDKQDDTVVPTQNAQEETFEYLGAVFTIPSGYEYRMNSRVKIETDTGVRICADVDPYNEDAHNLDDIDEASEKLFFTCAGMTQADIFIEVGGMERTVESEERVTINGIEMLKVTGTMHNRLSDASAEYIVYFFFTRPVPNPYPMFVAGFQDDRKADKVDSVLIDILNKLKFSGE